MIGFTKNKFFIEIFFFYFKILENILTQDILRPYNFRKRELFFSSIFHINIQNETDSNGKILFIENVFAVVVVWYKMKTIYRKLYLMTSRNIVVALSEMVINHFRAHNFF